MQRTLLILALLALATLGATLLLAPGGPPPVAADAAPRASASPGTAASAGAPEDVRTAAADDQRARRDPARTRTDVVAPASVPPAEAATEAPARVVGRVLGPGGRTLAGAEVAFVRRGPGGEGPSVATDVEGRFALAVEPARGESGPAYSLEVGAPGHVTRRDPWSAPGEGLTLDVGDVALERATTLAGRVVDADGNGVAGAELRLLDETGGPFRAMFVLEEEPQAVADAAGYFRLDRAPVGPWQLRVDTERLPPGRFTGETTTTVPEALDLRLELGRGAELTGRVTGLPNGDARGLEVVATRADMQVELFERRVAPLTREATFRLEGLEPEAAYRLVLREADEQRRRSRLFDDDSLAEPAVVRAGGPEAVLDYLPGATLTLNVVDAATGEPIEDFEARVALDYRDRPLVGPDPGRRTHFPGGVARAEDLRFRGADERDLGLESVGYEPRTIPFVPPGPGETLDLGRVELEPTEVLAVEVLDRVTGEPIEGALVSLTPAREPEPDGDRNVSISVRVDATTGEQTVDLGDGRRTRRTDAEGRARFSAFAVERLDLEVRADGYAPEQVRGLALVPERPHAVRLGRGGTLEVTVVDAGGAPVTGARIAHRAGDGSDDRPRPAVLVAGMGGLSGRREVRTDARGRATLAHLAPGPHRVRLADDPGPGVVLLEQVGGGAERDPWTAVEIEAGATAELTLVAGRGTTLSGGVSQAGEPLAGATVTVEADRGGPAGFVSFGGGPSARTDADGRFRIEGLAPGKVTLVVTHPSRAMPARIVDELVGTDERRELALAVAAVRGRVLDGDGRPVAGARVRARRVSGGGTSVVGGMLMVRSGGGSVVSFGGDDVDAVRTDEDGRYELFGLTPEVELEVVAEAAFAEEGRSEPFEVAADEVREGLDLELDPAGAVAVRVTDPEGAPAGMGMLRAEFLGTDEGVDPRSEFLPDAGELELEGLRPGPWRIVLQRFADGGPEDVDAAEVEVLAGERVEVGLVKP